MSHQSFIDETFLLMLYNDHSVMPAVSAAVSAAVFAVTAALQGFSCFFIFNHSCYDQ